MVEALAAGDEDVCRQVVFELLLAGHRTVTICDEVIAESFRAIGQKWDCGEVEVYQERRGCEICMRVLHELQRTLPAPSPNAPLAMGAAPEGDNYMLPTTMVELALRDAGWRAESLGWNLPFATLKAAVVEYRPRMFWLSVSHLPDRQAFLQGYAELVETCGSRTAVVVGGRALDEESRKQMKVAAHCFNLAQLDAFAAAINPSQGAA
jgi:methanogenic corrinoid protein MtbC1